MSMPLMPASGPNKSSKYRCSLADSVRAIVDPIAVILPFVGISWAGYNVRVQFKHCLSFANQNAAMPIPQNKTLTRSTRSAKTE